MAFTMATICVANCTNVCIRKFKRPFVSFYSQTSDDLLLLCNGSEKEDY